MTAADDAQRRIDAITDDLLERWHEWRSGYTGSRGYRSRDATCKDAQSAWSSYDRENGVPEAYTEDLIMRAVDRAVERIPDHPHPWHLMILFEARNLACEAAVWTTFRLPDGDEYDILRLEARNKLVIELKREGCISPPDREF